MGVYRGRTSCIASGLLNNLSVSTIKIILVVMRKVAAKRRRNVPGMDERVTVVMSEYRMKNYNSMTRDAD